ncbi:MAG: TlpA family protein disulfide reductase [Bryobacterales bacterium]|nr:TlpA family protein disulfide reductase [Bryobacterales bacterium]MBV9396993.1 TlpA family protein disulfide reductase [Bryobacterales bacterium]
MRKSQIRIRTLALFCAVAGFTFAQQTPFSIQPPPAAKPSDAEQEELMKAVNEAGNSSLDLIRTLEKYLEKYPQTVQRPDIEFTLAKAAIENKDHPRTVKYGERVLSRNPEDVLILDRTAQALLALGGPENLQQSIKYARKLEDLIQGMGKADGNDAAQHQEDRDRALARMVLVQSRARAMLDEKLEASQLAARAFEIYPSEESARVWSESLVRMGREPEAVTHLAEAFAIPDPHSTDADRQTDRQRLGELYSQLHGGSEKGLGDVILEAYDRTTAITNLRHQKLMALDPNSAAANPSEFTITGLDGKKLKMASLEGKVVVLDFWATWCAPCRAQHPLYEEVKKHYGKRDDLVFLPLDTDEDHSVVQPFLEENMWDKLVYFDDGLARLLQVQQIPTTVLLDKHGKIASRMNGFLPENFVQVLTARIDAALADK